MKKINTIAIVLIALLFLASCTKDNIVPVDRQKSARKITAIFENDVTKTTLGSDNRTPQWSEGDVIRILGSTDYEDITLSAGDIVNNRFTVTLTKQLTGTLYAVYPSSVTSISSCNDGNIDFTVPGIQDGTFASANICVAKGDDKDNLVFRNATAILEFSQDASSTGVTSVRVEAENNVAGTVTASFADNVLNLATTALSKKTIAIRPFTEAEDKYYVAVAPVTTGQVDFKYYAPLKESSGRRTSNDLIRNKIYELTIPVAGYSDMYVTIGGLKWATVNLGATTVAGNYETCCGDYYQWGSVNTLYKSKIWNGDHMVWSFEWKEGKEYGISDIYREYNGSDSVLPSANDVVKQRIGKGWRMPSKEDFLSLAEACFAGDNVPYQITPTPGGSISTTAKGIYWCDDYDGVAGVLFCDGTSKVFFPATGRGFENCVNDVGIDGKYWSSSQGDARAYILRFSESSVFPLSTDYYGHYEGFPVRPVYDGEAAPEDSEPDILENALPGIFTVSDGGTPSNPSDDVTVRFSRGNLRYVLATEKWGFFEHQYDICNTATYQGHHSDTISLFTWGYGEWSTVPDTKKWLDNVSAGHNFSYDNDWGSQVNDGNVWRTLSKDEWEFLLNVDGTSGRSDENRFARAMVNGVKGLLIFPDEYDLPSGYSASEGGPGMSKVNKKNNAGVDEAPFPSSNIPSEKWTEMESSGVVFLPAAGERYGSSIYNNHALYWSSTAIKTNDAYSIFFDDTILWRGHEMINPYGLSVRLVKNWEIPI